MNLALSEKHTLYHCSISPILNGKFLRVVAKRMWTVSLNIFKHLAIFNCVKIVLFLREILSMTLEGKEMVFTRITWGELDGANSEQGETTEFPRCLLWFSRELNARVHLTFPLKEMYGYSRLCDCLRSSAIIWKQLSLRSSAICDPRSPAIVCDPVWKPALILMLATLPKVESEKKTKKKK